MKKILALVVSIIFSLSMAGFAMAQAPAPKTDEKKSEKVEKKETRASCLKAAKDDADKKAECEKKFPKKTGKKTEAAPKKTEGAPEKK